MTTYLSEEQLEDLVFDNRHVIHEKGLPVFYEHTVRQFYLPDKKKIDILTWEIRDNVLRLRIIELKTIYIDLDAIKQILGYFGTVTRLTAGRFSSVLIDLVLIGDTLGGTNYCVAELIPMLKCYKYTFGYNGLSFGTFEKIINTSNGFISACEKLTAVLKQPTIIERYGYCSDFETTEEQVTSLASSLTETD